MSVPAIETASSEKIEGFQFTKLKELLRFVSSSSPFYKRHFLQNQIDITSFSCLGDLEKIPPISKKDLQKFNKDFYTIGRSSILDYCHTSGTEGASFMVPLSEKDLQRLAYNEAISMACAGGGKGELYQLTTTADRRFMAGLAYIEGARRLGAGMVRVGPGIPSLQWDTIKEVKPTTLIIVPSFLLKLIEYAEQEGIDFHNGSVKKAICIGEPIRNQDFSLNALGTRINDRWGIKLYSTYASTEMATAFTECEHGRGGHTHPELIITEILDESGNPLPNGEVGELTITTLGVEGMPLIRFRTGDILAKYGEKCPCGRNTERLGPVVGRKNQMIKYKGTTVYPPVLFNVMDKLPEVDMYFVEVYSDSFGNDQIRVNYALRDVIGQQRLINLFKSKARVTPQLNEMTSKEIRAVVFKEMNRKPLKFIDRRKRNG